MHRCAKVTLWRRSPMSAPLSCSPRSAPRDPRRHAAAGGGPRRRSEAWGCKPATWHHSVVNEPMSDALFGIDGTESPEVLPDPSARAGWRDAPDLPPLVLPALPDASVIREAIAAALGEDPTRPVDPDLDASAQPHAAQVNAAQPNPTQVGGLPPAGPPSHRTVAPSVTTTVASPGPLPRRTVRPPRYRTSLAASS